MGLFADKQHIPLDVVDSFNANAWLDYYPRFLDEIFSQALYEELLANTPWEQERITVYGKQHLSPRLTAWYGDDKAVYTYSGIKHHPHGWTAALSELKQQVEAATGERFNSALLNLYRNGEDSVGWHSDDERELGNNPVIASVSLGAERRFQIKPRKKSSQSKTLLLQGGSLLLMSEGVQRHYYHQVPKQKAITAERINITFRQING